MAIVKSNNTQWAAAREQTFGVLPGSPSWLQLEPNGITRWGAEITKVTRNPINKSRQRRKGATVDLDSGVGLDTDLTMEHLIEFAEGFAFASYAHPGGTGVASFVVTAVTATGYTVAAAGDLAERTLIYGRGHVNAANNGLKMVGAASIATEIKTAGLVAEAAIPASQNAHVDVAGVAGAAADLEIDVNGDLISTLLDFTTLDLTVGQFIWIGGDAALNRFAIAANRGLARITAIAANKLTLDKTTNVLAVDDGAAKEIHIYYGRYLRNVAVDHASYLIRSYTVEGVFPQLGVGPVDMYQYASGNYCDELAFALPLADKAGLAIGLVGKDTAVPTTVRATDANAPRVPVRTAAFNTTADIARLIVMETDETGISTYFKDLNLTIRNGVSPEKVLGTLGAIDMNTGDLEVDIEATLVFSNHEVIEAVRENRTVTMHFGLRNDDGGFVVDLPSMTIEGGELDLPENESVTVSMNAMAHQDAVLGTSFSLSLFPYMPAS